MTDNVNRFGNVNNDVTGGFSTGDIWRAASDKIPFHRGSEARHRRVWKGLYNMAQTRSISVDTCVKTFALCYKVSIIAGIFIT
jgi:hypothetical protein